MSAIKLKPLHDRVIIKRTDEERTTAGGIVIPDTAAEKPSKGKVVAIGTGRIMDDGKVRPLAVKVGDVILFGKYAGNEVKLDNQEYIVMREDDIMAIIEK
jgi:chaperonin GroES